MPALDGPIAADHSRSIVFAKRQRRSESLTFRAGYRPLGFGSHHWEVADTRGARWFLINRRHPLDIAAQVEAFSKGVSEVVAQLLAALDPGAVGRLQIAIDVAVVLAEDLPVLARQVIVGEHYLIRRSAPERQQR